MISVSATTARSWTVSPLPANHRCLTSHVASTSSKVMGVYPIPLAGPGKRAPADLWAACFRYFTKWPRLRAAGGNGDRRTRDWRNEEGRNRNRRNGSRGNREGRTQDGRN